jgi:hypothetical protein
MAAMLALRTTSATALQGARLRSAPRRVFSRAAVRPMASGFYDLSAKDINGNDVAFSKFKGKVVLITNVASK